MAGAFQVALGLVVVAGWLRRWSWPAMAVVNGIALLAVWRSVVDPWGFVREGGNPVFYASTVIFAGIRVGWALPGEDTPALDARGARG